MFTPYIFWNIYHIYIPRTSPVHWDCSKVANSTVVVHKWTSFWALWTIQMTPIESSLGFHDTNSPSYLLYSDCSLCSFLHSFCPLHYILITSKLKPLVLNVKSYLLSRYRLWMIHISSYIGTLKVEVIPILWLKKRNAESLGNFHRLHSLW